MIIILLACASGSGSISLAWTPLYDLPMTYDADADLWLAEVPGGCSPELRLTATCEQTGEVGEEALSWRVDFADADMEIPPCDVGVEAPEEAGPCTATIWGWADDSGN